MKILHCCLAAFYIDNYGYQENILPKMHKLQGHEVAILASTENYIDNKYLGYVKPSSYLNENGISVQRIPYINYLPHAIVKKIRIYHGVFKALDKFKPDIIFLHDCQFISIKEVVKYVKENRNVKVFVDSHTDYINSGRGWLSKTILHQVIYKWCAQKIQPYTEKFFGTLPSRSLFYKEVYGISKEKLDLLVMGADDSQIDFKNKNKIRSSIRQKLNIDEDDFVVISGGKINEAKKIHNLMLAIESLNKKNVKVILFGEPDEEMENEIKVLSKRISSIRNIGWLASSEVYDYLLSSDLACFPGTHSVLWEQAVGTGLPCIFRTWQGMNHVDVGGNCLFLKNGDKEEIAMTIRMVVEDKRLYKKMKSISESTGIKSFAYSSIAKKAIGEDVNKTV